MVMVVDTIDRQIIRQLQADGRRTNVEIARVLGLSEATVRKRIDRLVSEGAIRITALPNPACLGCPVDVLISLSVETSRLEEVGRQIAVLPATRRVFLVAGDADLFVQACFPSNEDLLRFLTVDLGGIAGITGTSTQHLLRAIKGEADWRIPEPGPPRILLADDDPDFVETTRLVLESQGYEVQAVASGDDALVAMREARPDLVILDVMMRGVLDGLHTVDTIASDSALRDIPIMMVSSILDTDHADLFPTDQYIPVTEFLCKPVAAATLLATVRAALR
ncbi:MAG: response regulator [Chloroflexi bacterium]|nr:response regulator [Chloroflexota bacterium]MBU1749257.1 response regulator [Chloroflexota bacterium]